MGRREKVGTLCGVQLKEEKKQKKKTFFLEFLHTQFCCVGEPMECEPKMESIGSPDRDGAGERDIGAEGTDGMADCDVLKGAEEMEDGKKRKRKPYRPGQLPVSRNNI